MKQLNQKAGQIVLAALLTISGLAAISMGAGGEKPGDDRVHVVTWAADAKLSRKLTDAELAKLRAARNKGDSRPIPAYRALSDVKPGTELGVPDIVETKTASVDLKGGTLALTRLRPNTILKYISIKPTSLVGSKPAELILEVSKGAILNRVGTLTQPSTMQVNGPLLVTGAKGTAYSVAVTGEKTTLVVAEGTVEIALAVLPGETVAVNPRQKFTYDGASGAFPTAPVPTTLADEPLLEELLSLPVDGLFGYSTGRDIRRPDADSIVVVNVERILHHEDDTSFRTYKPTWGAPDSIYFAGREDFWTTDHNAKRMHIGQGFTYEGLAPDGKTIFASKPNLGLWAMNWDGTVKKRISARPIGEVQISPDGKRLLTQQGWGKEPIMKWDQVKKKVVKTSATRWVPNGGIFVTLSSAGGNEKVLNPKALTGSYAEPYWRRAGKRLIVDISGSNETNIIDADQTPAKELVHITVTNREHPQWRVSPAGNWAYGNLSVAEGPTRFVRLSDGKFFDHKTADAQQRAVGKRVLLGEQNVVDGDMKVYAIENVNDPGRPFDDERDHTYPQASSDVSPNGEILAYIDDGKELFHVPGNMGDLVGSSGLASFCDTLIPARNSVTAYNVHDLEEIAWINGYQVYYSVFTDPKKQIYNAILTLAVKKKPKASADDSNSTKAVNNSQSGSLGKLIGADEATVKSTLGSKFGGSSAPNDMYFDRPADGVYSMTLWFAHNIGTPNNRVIKIEVGIPKNVGYEAAAKLFGLDTTNATPKTLDESVAQEREISGIVGLIPGWKVSYSVVLCNENELILEDVAAGKNTKLANSTGTNPTPPDLITPSDSLIPKGNALPTGWVVERDGIACHQDDVHLITFPVKPCRYFSIAVKEKAKLDIILIARIVGEKLTEFDTSSAIFGGADNKSTWLRVAQHDLDWHDLGVPQDKWVTVQYSRNAGGYWLFVDGKQVYWAEDPYPDKLVDTLAIHGGRNGDQMLAGIAMTTSP